VQHSYKKNYTSEGNKYTIIFLVHEQIIAQTLVYELFDHMLDSFFSLVGAVGVIAGLYIVLWGKAKEFSEIKQAAPQPNLQDDEISSRIDLEQPLLSDKAEHVTETDTKV